MPEAVGHLGRIVRQPATWRDTLTRPEGPQNGLGIAKGSSAALKRRVLLRLSPFTKSYGSKEDLDATAEDGSQTNSHDFRAGAGCGVVGRVRR
jgi:hypothetical protein